MSQAVTPQVDVGVLSFRGLSAFAPLLNTLSADNVTPTAIIQLESLGSLFHVNGKFAAEVPNLLRRCASVRLEQLGLLVGWKKGDTASIMSQSAGGQSIALMCFCLVNTCRESEVGAVLYDLSNRLLSRNLAISSMNHLADVASLLASKLKAIGFGNFLAQQVVRIHDTCRHLGKTPPQDFFEAITRDSFVDLYHALSRVSTTEDIIVRIRGINATGDIMAIVLFMFPDNVQLIVDDLLIQEGPKPLILLEITSQADSSSITTIVVERMLYGTSEKAIDIEFLPNQSKIPVQPYSYRWSGHIADALRFTFGSLGEICSTDLIEACCDCVLLSLPHLGFREGFRDHFPLDGLMQILGDKPMQHVYQACQTVFGQTPSGRPSDAQQAFRDLALVFKRALSSDTSCFCSRPGIYWGWTKTKDNYGSSHTSRNWCRFHSLWDVVAAAIQRGISACFVSDQGNATTTVSLDHQASSLFTTRHLSDVMQGDHPRHQPDIYSLHNHILCLPSYGPHLDSESVIARSDGAGTIVPASVLQLHLHICTGYKYILLDGQVFFKDHYYQRLESGDLRARRTTCRSLFSDMSFIRPSGHGGHSSISFTAVENPNSLDIRTTASVLGRNVHLNLRDIVGASLFVIKSEQCEHDVLSKLDASYNDRVLTTSIANPASDRPDKIAIVQTKGNPAAQLLACGNGYYSLLQLDCCLTCAVKQAMAKGLDQIIVGV